jgi:hypothetical protein
LRIMLGIFNRKAREKGHSRRRLGYVPAYSVEEAMGNCTSVNYFMTDKSDHAFFFLIFIRALPIVIVVLPMPMRITRWLCRSPHGHRHNYTFTGNL